MTLEEYKKMEREVARALRTELTPDNKDVLDKLDESGSKLTYDGKEIEPDISEEANNYLSKKPDGFFAASAYVTTESSPVGEIIAFMGKTAPDHYLVCDGATITIGTYPLLEAFFKKQFGKVNQFGGDGTTNYKLPDLRGEFLRGTGESAYASGAGEAVGVHQAPTQIPYLYHAGSTHNFCSNGADNTVVNPDKYISGSAANTGRYVGTAQGNCAVSKSFIARPTNTSVLYCIKYEPTWIDGSASGGTTTPTETPMTEDDLDAALAWILAPETSTPAAS